MENLQRDEVKIILECMEFVEATTGMKDHLQPEFFALKEKVQKELQEIDRQVEEKRMAEAEWASHEPDSNEADVNDF